MDPIYLDGSQPADPMDYVDDEEEEEEDQLVSDVDEPTPPPSTASSKPARHASEELEPDSDGEPHADGTKRKNRRTAGVRTPGTSLLPEARVDNILQENGAGGAMSKEATFILSVATEEFIRRFTQVGSSSAKAAQRHIIEYPDLASAAASMKRFSMLEDVVPRPKPLSLAMDLRAQFVSRQIAEDPALTAIAEPPPPLPDPAAPLVAYPSAESSPWDTPTSTPAPPTKRQKAAAAAGATNGKRKSEPMPAPLPAKERRASVRQRDKHGRFSQGASGPGSVHGWSSDAAHPPPPAPLMQTQPHPEQIHNHQVPAPQPLTGPGSGFINGPGETPFGSTGRTIYSQR